MSVEGMKFRPLTLEERLTIYYERQLDSANPPTSLVQFKVEFNDYRPDELARRLTVAGIPTEIPDTSVAEYTLSLQDRIGHFCKLRRLAGDTPATGHTIIHMRCQEEPMREETVIWLHAAFDDLGIARTSSDPDAWRADYLEALVGTPVLGSPVPDLHPDDIATTLSTPDFLKESLVTTLQRIYDCTEEAARNAADYAFNSVDPDRAETTRNIPLYSVKSDEELVREFMILHKSSEEKASVCVQYANFGCPSMVGERLVRVERFEEAMAKFGISVLRKAPAREYDPQEMQTHLRRAMLTDDNFAYFMVDFAQTLLVDANISATKNADITRLAFGRLGYDVDKNPHINPTRSR